MISTNTNEHSYKHCAYCLHYDSYFGACMHPKLVKQKMSQEDFVKKYHFRHYSEENKLTTINNPDGICMLYDDYSENIKQIENRKEVLEILDDFL